MGYPRRRSLSAMPLSLHDAALSPRRRSFSPRRRCIFAMAFSLPGALSLRHCLSPALPPSGALCHLKVTLSRPNAHQRHTRIKDAHQRRMRIKAGHASRPNVQGRTCINTKCASRPNVQGRTRIKAEHASRPNAIKAELARPNSHNSCKTAGKRSVFAGFRLAASDIVDLKTSHVHRTPRG